MEFFTQLTNKNRIHFNGEVFLSIQAGPYYYSQPKDSQKFTDYTHYELGIKGVDLSWYDPLEVHKVTHEDGLAVYAEVPVQLIETLFLYFKKTYGMKEVVSIEKLLGDTTTKNQTFISSLTRKFKQKMFIIAMNNTTNEEVYEQLGCKLQKTIEFIED